MLVSRTYYSGIARGGKVSALVEGCMNFGLGRWGCGVCVTAKRLTVGEFQASSVLPRWIDRQLKSVGSHVATIWIYEI